MVKSVVVDSLATNHIAEFTKAPNNLKQINTVESEKVAAAFTDVFKKDVNDKQDADKVNATDVLDKLAKKEANEEDKALEQAFETVADFMNLYNRNVNFSRDDGSDKTIIKVFDSDSKELIKQFPSEDLIELARKIHEVRKDVDLKSGIFLDEKV